MRYAKNGLLGFLGGLSLLSSTWGQGDLPNRLEQQIERVQTVHREFDEHTARRAKLLKERESMQATLRETEQDMGRVRDEAIRRQMQLLLLQWEEASINQAFSDEINRIQSIEPKSEQERINQNRISAGIQQNLALNSILSRNDQFNVALDLNQLDSVAQTVVQRRLAVFQDGARWQQDVAKWIQDRPKFFERYWLFTDPSRVQSVAECEKLLDALRGRTPDNFPAILAQALLETRLGYRAEAIANLDRIIQEKTPLQGVAFAARGLVYGLADERKRANTDMVNALKLDKTNPFVRFLRARYNASIEEWKVAESEANALLKNSFFELDARRLLVVLHAIQAQKVPRNAAKAREHARVLRGLGGDNDWHSRLLTSMALFVSKSKNEAVVHGELAIELAVEEQKEFAEGIVEAIRNDAPLTWDFKRF